MALRGTFAAPGSQVPAHLAAFNGGHPSPMASSFEVAVGMWAGRWAWRGSGRRPTDRDLDAK